MFDWLKRWWDNQRSRHQAAWALAFANKPTPTPRYDYNQILYQLDLNVPGLKAAQGR